MLIKTSKVILTILTLLLFVIAVISAGLGLFIAYVDYKLSGQPDGLGEAKDFLITSGVLILLGFLLLSARKRFSKNPSS